MHFGFGLITAQHHPDDRRTDVGIYRDAVDLAVECERLGFESVWTSEHHFVDDGYMPSLLPVLAAIAARTERVLLGTGVLLAPMFDPLHLAEDAATVDLLSNGRLVLGLGIGWRDEEFAGFGDPIGHKGRRLEAMIEVLRAAWSDGLVTGDRAGIYRYPEPGLNVTPKPARPGGPPIWIGAGAEAAVRRAGRVADGYLSSGTTPERLAMRLGWIRDEALAAGRDPASITPAIHHNVFAWRDGDAWETIRDAAWYMSWKYDDMRHARGSRRAGHPPPPTAEEEAALRARTIVGTPEQVAEGILAFRDVLGENGHFIARSYFPGLDPAIQRETLRLLGDEVRPLLARGDVVAKRP
jgi:alkanesulfonate monooxygenase SsuD/methylene tetrahydromethanopterin reductase-like flavin-dependent oxidoreductase (luciferase family)